MKTICSICLKRIKSNQSTTILSCKHAFHHQCFVNWEECSCPNCRHISMDIHQHKRFVYEFMPSESRRDNHVNQTIALYLMFV
jgi:hypothetical protein